MSKPELQKISPQDAYDLLHSDTRAILIDVRSSMEYLFVGHPTGSIHLAWIDEPDWNVNPDFVKEIRQLMLGGLVSGQAGGNAPIILICRSGKRSKEAGELLIKEGFDQVYNIDEGFEGDRDESYHRSTLGGWRFRGLPWEQC